MVEVELKSLITLLHDRPILWDKIQKSYKDRIQTRNAWVKVFIFKELNDGFEELGQQEKS